MFHNHLLSYGVAKDHIVEVVLDDRNNKALRDPDRMLGFVKSKILDNKDYFIILDEIQYMDEFEDVGLRNARLGFRQIEENHLMGNIIYNELRVRGFHVDVGSVPYYDAGENKKRRKRMLEIDFVASSFFIRLDFL